MFVCLLACFFDCLIFFLLVVIVSFIVFVRSCACFWLACSFASLSGCFFLCSFVCWLVFVGLLVCWFACLFSLFVCLFVCLFLIKHS